MPDSATRAMLKRHQCITLQTLKKATGIALQMLNLLKQELQIALLALVCGTSLLTPYVHAQAIKIDTTSARAVIEALKDPSLTYDRAAGIAKLEGNQGMIRKMRELHEAENEEQFARALVLAAHGQAADANTPEGHYDFLSVKRSAPVISLLLDQIEQGLENEVRAGIRPYAPKPDAISIQGFVVAGGDGGGYAFGGSDFYLNIAKNDDLPQIKQVLIHEAFHGVQGAVYNEDTEHWSNQNKAADLTRGKFCSSAAELFMDMRNEGTAKFVGSDEIIKDSKSATGQRLYGEFLYGYAHLRDSADLLEISIASLQAPTPVPFRKVYSVDFFGRGIVYDISSAMTKAIAEEDGPAGVAQVIQQPGYEFVLRYTRLTSYGKDDAHPRLGENTVHAAQVLHDRCNAV